MTDTTLKLFQDTNIRTQWDADAEKWYFSIVDVIAALTESDYQHSRNYWKVLKSRLKAEGNETVTNCNQLKLVAPDGKLRMTDVADTEQLLRLIQSVPSKKAEPFKLWLDENMAVAKRGGNVARQARLQLEQETGKKVVSGANSKLLKRVDKE